MLLAESAAVSVHLRFVLVALVPNSWGSLNDYFTILDIAMGVLRL